MEESNERKIEHILENFSHIVPIIKKIFITELRAKVPLSPQTFYVLAALAYHKKLTMSGIGCHLMVPKPHVTALVDKLISEEMVERLNDEKDRRIIYIELTEKGKKAFAEIKKIQMDSLHKRLSFLEQEKLDQLNNSARIMSEIMVDVWKSMQENS